MLNLTFSFTPTKKDYIDAMRSFAIRQLLNFNFMNIIMFFLFVLAGLIFYILFDNLWFLAIGFFSLVAIIGLFLFVVPYTAGRQVDKQERLRTEVTWEVNSEKIRILTQHTIAEVDWGTFQKFFDTPRYYLLIYTTNKGMYQFIPKCVFQSQQDESLFRQLLQQKYGSG